MSIQAEILDWDNEVFPAGALTTQTFTIGAGTVDITPGGNTAAYGTPALGGIVAPAVDDRTSGGLNPRELSLDLVVDYPAGTPVAQREVTLDILFNYPGGVTDISFTAFDVDNNPGTFIDEISVTAEDIFGNTFNPDSLTVPNPSVNQIIDPSTVRGNGSSNDNVLTDTGNATYVFNRPNIRRLIFRYRNQQAANDPAPQAVQLHDITFFPEADLSIIKSHVGNFIVGNTQSYQIDVTNNGPNDIPLGEVITVTDTLAAGFTFNAAGSGGNGWACNATAQDVTCNLPGPLVDGATSTFNIAVDVDNSVANTVNNTANVSANVVDNTPANNSSTDATIINRSDLSTSVKGFIDINGGNIEPGDIIRYVINIAETAGVTANNVLVVDDIPGQFTGGFTIISLPPGATNNSSQPPSGANSAGQINVSNISVPANGNVIVMFESQIDLAAPPGSLINNIATITNPNGISATINVQVAVFAAQAPVAGNKPLYILNNNDLSRIQPPPLGGNAGSIQIARNNGTATFTLNPATSDILSLINTDITVDLFLSRRNDGNPGCGNLSAHNLVVDLLVDQGAGNTLIGSVTQAVNLDCRANPTSQIFNIPVGTSLASLPAGTTFTLQVTNITGGGNNNNVRLFGSPVAGSFSTVQLTASTVINIQNIEIFDVGAAGSCADVQATDTPVTEIINPTNICVRTRVNDPFGAFDITRSGLTVFDSTGNPISTLAADTAMTPFADANNGPSQQSFEFTVNIPANLPGGLLTVEVTSDEGAEGIVSDTERVVITVGQPRLAISKTATPSNAIVGQTVVFDITVTNRARAMARNVEITDVLSSFVSFNLDPDNTGTLDGSQAIRFIEGTPASGITINTIEFSDVNDPPGSFTYLPSSGASGAPPGFDNNITGFRIRFNGMMNGSDANFTLQYETQVK